MNPEFFRHLIELRKNNKAENSSLITLFTLLDAPLSTFYKHINKLSSISTFWPDIIKACIIQEKPKHFNLVLKVLNKKYNKFEVETIIKFFITECDFSDKHEYYKPSQSILVPFVNNHLEELMKGANFYTILQILDSYRKLNKKLIFNLISKNLDVMNFLHISSYKDENLLNFYLKKIGYNDKHYDQIIGTISEGLKKYDLNGISHPLEEIIKSNIVKKINPKTIKEFENSIFYPGYMLFEGEMLENPDVATHFLITNKSLKKAFYKHFAIKKEKYTIYNCVPGLLIKEILKHLPNFDQQLLVPLLEQTAINLKDFKNQSIYDSLIDDASLSWFIKFLEKRKLNFTQFLKQTINSNDLIYLKDLKYSLYSIREGNFFDANNIESLEFINQSIEKRNLNSIKKMHDFFNRSVIDKNKLPLSQKYTHMNGYKVQSYTIKVPQHPDELVKVGHTLGICVGNGRYAQMVRRKESKIFFLMDEAIPIYCVEINNNTVLQAKTLHNGCAPERLVKEIEKIIPIINDASLLEKKEVSYIQKILSFFSIH